ncbi:ATP-binding protein [Natrialba taiwanensis]|uniref:DNA helicase n=1 Tax=Natrialba taiwanensis DSM 12281 TaxID=1230458 RepID=L9ZY58_9EURY|nr:minichromosome maintenance protein MCM [Natrialba taiwanensis]ELY91445.1 MCM family protein [Natrialba taiwanensis DSM 12281]
MTVQLSKEDIEDLQLFLRRYYKEDILELAQKYPNEQRSLEVDYADIYQYDPDLADDIHVQPEPFLDGFDEALRTFDVSIDVDLEKARVRIVNAEPNKRVNSLRSEDIERYISVTAQTEEITQVKPEIRVGVFKCKLCDTKNYAEKLGDTISPPNQCDGCERKAGFDFLRNESEIRDKQLINLKPLPEDSGGDTTGDLKVEAYGDLAGDVKAGDRIKVSGQLKMDVDSMQVETNPDASRDLYMRANGFEREQESFDDLETTRLDEIKELASRPDLYEALIRSFAPHILTDDYGDTLKLGTVLQLFGGVRRELPNGVTRRGDINVLLVGEPGTGKSQYLSASNEISPKGVKASGKGATAAGLTATAEQSELTGGWSLKAGALVMANNGHACIDEFDKMSDGARKSMHEALEDQEIPINKAGMNVTLPAQCSVLAAANPEYGRYDRTTPLSEQINLGPTLISRFDLIYGLTDSVNEERDKNISRHQLKTTGDDLEPEIETDLLREYVAYARQNVRPSWPDGEPEEELAEYYADLRDDSDDETMGPSIGPRMNDGLRRLSEASARARLSDEVETQDVERAMSLMNFHIGQVALDEEGNITQADGSKPVKQQKREEFAQLKPDILEVIGEDELFQDEIARAVGHPESKVGNYLETMTSEGDLIEENGKYRVND